MQDPKTKIAELAMLERIINEIEEWGSGEIVIKIQDGQIVFGESIKKLKHKF